MARIVVAMSGGVDSSVAAALLKEQGHEVIGIMLRLWSEPGVIEEEDDGVERVVQNKCCSLESVDDARRVARMLDIPFYLVNVEQEFKDKIVDSFYDEYVAGRTPNPCLTCNRHIRFTVMLNKALALDADYLATGHYVRVDNHPVTGKRRLRRGLDPEKDQSYVLHVLNQYQLEHACFPLGGYTKPQVRAMAAERGMRVASKAESQEICFVAKNDYRGFIDRYAAARVEEGNSTSLITIPRPGPIYDVQGNVMGRHRGLAYYTVGQRKGLGITAKEPLHVLRIDAERNALIVGPAAALEKTEFTVKNMHYVSGDIPGAPFEALVRVRYKAPEQPALITPLPEQRALVQLRHPQRAITPGQAAVLYGGEDGEEVLGGGIIE
ncbi:tRNA-specific 2-thiouridylase [Thermosporothrix hazakensis]|jgi:tRNA-specific 2-thiouridylase|uniref:tRNA-specific 2-thiouridylase MnmA n=2 Tax=Thermosporothrix TaxID=768650 RepID=A0A326UA94_THEHA|nr:tRNA 2-thiouridine(34) synthase MnmA [Thermosporothrix hazakensis]PZW33001.1 tRNA-specific 2-thiouridylase [Thermosporothrix hazakensis]BBH90983.1 tRNA-specific 2-thiouridylase MnmA [Thermosporothrix sp. COM3]GCE49033.1 tRNA-specific 2-thiouridylase MnmA [Thermosporothrix hazakensis]